MSVKLSSRPASLPTFWVLSLMMKLAASGRFMMANIWKLYISTACLLFDLYCSTDCRKRAKTLVGVLRLCRWVSLTLHMMCRSKWWSKAYLIIMLKREEVKVVVHICEPPSQSPVVYEGSTLVIIRGALKTLLPKQFGCTTGAKL